MTVSPAPHRFAGLPNLLTSLRMISIPFLVWGILNVAETDAGLLGRPSIVLGLFAFAAITDFLDGFLARRWKVTSDYGRMIDPIADKLLVAGCLIAICIVTQGNWVFLVPALAIIGRDILVSGAREHAANANIILPPTKLAKWKTACEMLAIAALIAWQSIRAWLPIDSVIPKSVDITLYAGLTALWLAAILSVYTGSLYFRAAIKS